LAGASYPQGKNENVESQANASESRAEIFEVGYFHAPRIWLKARNSSNKLSPAVDMTSTRQW
jgi:hypothetical protein